MRATLNKLLVLCGIAMVVLLTAGHARAETKEEYENRARLMYGVAMQMHEAVRDHLSDKRLADYCHDIAERNAALAERMTPPAAYAVLHPHLLLVLDNVERALFHAAKGEMARYRHVLKILEREIKIFDGVADEQRIPLDGFSRRY